MKNIAGALHRQVARKAPIYGVSVGNLDDKQTWSITFDPAATSQQISEAQAVLTAFDYNTVVDEEVLDAFTSAESESISSTTSTTYQTKASIVLPSDVQFLIYYSAEVSNSTLNRNVDCKLDIGGVSYGEVTYKVTSADFYSSFSGIKTYSALAPTTVSIMYRVGAGSSGTAYIKNARLSFKRTS